jgi:hypothetical protein
MAARSEYNVGQLIEEGVTNGTLTVLAKDVLFKVTRCEGTALPAAGSSGYATGCRLVRTDAVLGMSAEFVNMGTSSSSLFIPVTAPVNGYGVMTAGGFITSAGGDTTETLTIPNIMATKDISFVEHQTTNDTDQIVAQVVTANTITITGSADPSTAHAYAYAVIRQGAMPTWTVNAAGTQTSVGGDTAERVVVASNVATNIAFATQSATDDSDVIASVAAGVGDIDITVSADPSTTHGYHYASLSPVGTLQPSHYIAYAGLATTAGGAAAEAITVTGAAATDIPIVHWGGTDDTDTIKKAAVTANTLTVTLSADPSTAHKLAYMLLRAY